VLCGALWAPFTHLAANILEKRYNLTESSASTQASYLLAGSIVLYPICGFAVDRLKHPQAIILLFLVTSILTMSCYFWLALPPSWTKSPSPAVIAFACGIGFSPLLLVVIVPQIVPLKYVSTTLGVHKSLEQTGSTIFQTLAGLLLDSSHRMPAPAQEMARWLSKTSAIQHLLNILVCLNGLQFFSIVGLAILDHQKRKARETRMETPVSAINEAEEHTGIRDSVPGYHESLEQREPLLPKENGQGTSHAINEIRRGRIFARIAGFLIVVAWILFLVTAWLKLRPQNERGTQAVI